LTFEEASKVARALEENRPESKSRPHVLGVTLLDKDSKILGQWFEVSEEHFGFLGHTEQKALSRIKGLTPGSTIEFSGHYSPCNFSAGCNKIMSEFAIRNKVNIRYRWVHEGGTTIIEFPAEVGRIIRTDIPRKGREGDPIH
jgi:hypothetical protein